MVAYITANFFRNSDGRFVKTQSCKYPIKERDDLVALQEFMEEWVQELAEARNWSVDVFIEKITQED